MAKLLFRAVNVWRNEGSLIFFQKIKEQVLFPRRYKQWIRNNEPSQMEISKQKAQSELFPYRPLISIIIPVYNTPIEILHATINSVKLQTYENWQLCIANGSPEVRTLSMALAEYEKQDHRVKVIHLSQNLGIAGNTNAAIQMADGEFIGFLDHDDCLAPFALYEVLQALQSHLNADLIYSDEDILSSNGRKRLTPHFKPAFSPDLLRSLNYITHFTVIRKATGDLINWLREGYDGSQDYDLILRIIELAREIVHIPKVLYHWRSWEASTTNQQAILSPAKQRANEAGKKALHEHLSRIGLENTVEDGPDPTLYQVRYTIHTHPLVSIIILTHDHVRDLRKCLKSIWDKSTYQNYEIILIENSSQEPETFLFYQELKKQSSVRLIHYSEPFNLSRAKNLAANHSQGDILLFMNNNMEVISPDWQERMLEHVLRPKVAIVGAKLLYPNGTIQHAGVIAGIGGFAGHSHKYFPGIAKGYVNRLRLIQNCSAVTEACMMIRKEVFNELNGFDEGYILAASDIDLCLKALDKHYLNIWTPYAKLYHHESKASEIKATKEKQERLNQDIARFKQKWSSFLEAGDPYYNPNLTLSSENFGINPNRVQAKPRTYQNNPGYTSKQ